MKKRHRTGSLREMQRAWPYLRHDMTRANRSYLLNCGWTDGAIKKFLGPPDRKLVMHVGQWRTGVYRLDRPKLVWNGDRVRAAEDSPAFRAWMKRRQELAEQRGSSFLDVRRAKGGRRGQRRRLMNVIGRRIPAALRDLSGRDRRIARLLLAGRTQAAAGRREGVSQQTVSRVWRHFKKRAEHHFLGATRRDIPNCFCLIGNDFQRECE